MIAYHNPSLVSRAKKGRSQDSGFRDQAGPSLNGGEAPAIWNLTPALRLVTRPAVAEGPLILMVDGYAPPAGIVNPEPWRVTIKQPGRLSMNLLGRWSE
jgi:hypothetical protein